MFLLMKVILCLNRRSIDDNYHRLWKAVCVLDNWPASGHVRGNLPMENAWRNVGEGHFREGM